MFMLLNVVNVHKEESASDCENIKKWKRNDL